MIIILLRFLVELLELNGADGIESKQNSGTDSLNVFSQPAQWQTAVSHQRKRQTILPEMVETKTKCTKNIN